MIIQTATTQPRQRRINAAGGDILRFSGRSKDLMKSERPGLMLLRFKDPERSVSVAARFSNPTKAALANEMSTRMFSYLHEFRIPNHFVEGFSESDASLHR